MKEINPKSNLSAFNDNFIYPKLFEIIDTVFPEFEFKRVGNNWVSSNKLRLTGEIGNNVGSVNVYSNSPFFIQDYSSGGKALTTYIQMSKRANSWIDAVKWLAAKAGVELPELSEADTEKQEALTKRTQLLEAVNVFFMDCLRNDEFTGDRGQEEHRKYLGDRGYTKLLKDPKQSYQDPNLMELGFAPPKGTIREFLRTKGYAEDDIDQYFFRAIVDGELKSLHPAIGDTHRLTIPFRDTVGRIQGFVFRDIKFSKDSSTPKYIISTGFKRSSYLFNLRAIKGDKDLIIVEGLLDAIYIRALGKDNVVALVGTNLNVGQVRIAKDFGAKNITLCLDNDTSGSKGTDAALKAIYDSREDIKVYIAKLPEGFKDPDELIRAKGLYAFTDMVAQAKAHYHYQLDKHFDRLDAVFQEKGNIEDKDRDDFLNEAVRIGSKTTGPIERDLFTDALLARGRGLGITKQGLDDAIANLAHSLEQEVQNEEFVQTLKRAETLTSEGRISQAHELMSTFTKKANVGLLDASFHALTRPITEKQVSDSLKHHPDNIDSGFYFGESVLPIPSGAITIIAAPTSHGKTTFQINLALNIASQVRIKPVYLFSYEESREAILLKTFNTFLNKGLSGYVEVSRGRIPKGNNRELILKYFKSGDTSGIKPELVKEFTEKKEQFFAEFIETGRIQVHYVDYSAEELVGAIRYLHKNTHVGAILIDYMQLLRSGRGQTGSRQEELKQICLDLKNCAVETGLPIVLGAQFNRTVLETDDLHPTAIGEAGDIERIANLIVGFWNKRFPELKDKGADKHRQKTAPVEEIFATILKGRDIGAGAEETFSFNGNTGKISKRMKTTNTDSVFGSTASNSLVSKKPEEDFKHVSITNVIEDHKKKFEPSKKENKDD